MKRAVFVIIALLTLVGCTRVQKNNTEKIISNNQNNNTQEEISNNQNNNTQENISKEFNVPDFSEDKIGTYMPILFIDELKKTNNYLEAMLINNDRYYDVICINKNIVYSNLKFHDQFAIMSDDVKLFAFSINRGATELTDKNGYKYIKISKDLDYYRAYEIYVNNHFFDLLNKFKQNVIAKTDNGFIFNEKKWIINLDVLNYPKDDNFMYFYEKRNGEYIGIQYINNEIRIYNLEPDDDDFLAQKNKNILLTIK